MSWAELLAAAEAIRNDASAAEPRLAELPIVGVGWATVETERAVDELATILGGGAAWKPQERDGLLGATVLCRDPAPDDGPELLVLEPDTESRLAAFLARFGEGVGAVYLDSEGRESDQVVSVNARWGPYVVLRSRGG